MKKLIIAAVFAMSLSQVHAQSYTEILDSWVGVPATSLVEKWSYPTRTFQATSGNLVYAYEKSTPFTVPAFQMPSTTYQNQYQYSRYGSIDMSTTQNGMVVGGQTVMLTCNTYFEINQDQVVVGGSWQGNSCK